jgi:hypothetical protein
MDGDLMYCRALTSTFQWVTLSDTVGLVRRISGASHSHARHNSAALPCAEELQGW